MGKKHCSIETDRTKEVKLRREQVKVGDGGGGGAGWTVPGSVTRKFMSEVTV